MLKHVADRRGCGALLLATSEAQHAVHWAVVGADQPGVPRSYECGARNFARGRPIRRPANFECRSATVPRLRPALRGLQGRPVPASGGALSLARRSLAHSVSADAGALRAARRRGVADAAQHTRGSRRARLGGGRRCCRFTPRAVTQARLAARALARPHDRSVERTDGPPQLPTMTARRSPRSLGT